MPHYRCQFFFREDGFGTGWSESFDTVAATAEVAADAMDAPAKLRSALLGDGVTLTHVRVSNIAVAGDVLLKTKNYTGTPPDANANPDDPFVDGSPLIGGVRFLPPADVPWNGFLVKFSHPSGHDRTVLIRGVPDCVNVNPGPAIADSVIYKQRITRYINGVINKGFIFQTYSFPGENPAENIDGTLSWIGVDPTFNRFTLLGAVNAVRAGDHVRIRMLRPGGKEFTGLYIARGPGANASVTLQKQTFRLSDFGQTLKNFPYECKVCLQTFTTYEIQSGEIVRESHRKTGAPFGQSVGRRKTRV